MKIKNLQNLMVSIGLKKASSADLLKVGLPQVSRTKEQQAALTALYAATAKEKTPSKDVFRLNRADAAGNQQADGGDLIFTAEGQKMVTPSALVADLTKFGYHLTVAEIFQSEGNEEHIKLRLTFSRSSSVQVTLTDLQKVVQKYFDSTYWKLFGFYNPESVGLEGDQSPIQGSIVTLNFSGVMNAATVAQNQGNIREVRMTDADGHLECPIIPTTATPQRCPERPASSPGEAYDNGTSAKR